MQSWRTNPLAFDLMRAASIAACAAVDAVFFAAVCGFDRMKTSQPTTSFLRRRWLQFSQFGRRICVVKIRWPEHRRNRFRRGEWRSLWTGSVWTESDCESTHPFPSSFRLSSGEAQ